MNTEKQIPQWTMTVTIFHGSNNWHEMVMATETRRRGYAKQALGMWQSLGVPEDVLNSARTMIESAFVEHLVTRYGIKGELPVKWAGDPDPF